MIAVLGQILLNLSVFAFIAWATPARGWTLFWALLALGAGVGSFNLLIEAVAFDVIGWRDAALSFGREAGIFAVLAALVCFAPRATTYETPPANFGVLRIIGVMLAYQVLYIGAGLLALPHVQEFYAARELPGLSEVLSLQAVRALVFVASSALLLRAGLRYAPLVLGVAFAVLGGLAPLLPENPFMPPEVRAVHAIEVGVSNFVFGMVTAWLLTGGKRAPRAVAA